MKRSSSCDSIFNIKRMQKHETSADQMGNAIGKSGSQFEDWAVSLNVQLSETRKNNQTQIKRFDLLKKKANEIESKQDMQLNSLVKLLYFSIFHSFKNKF